MYLRDPLSFPACMTQTKLPVQLHVHINVRLKPLVSATAARLKVLLVAPGDGRS